MSVVAVGDVAALLARELCALGCDPALELDDAPPPSALQHLLGAFLERRPGLCVLLVCSSARAACAVLEALRCFPRTRLLFALVPVLDAPCGALSAIDEVLALQLALDQAVLVAVRSLEDAQHFLLSRDPKAGASLTLALRLIATDLSLLLALAHSTLRLPVSRSSKCCDLRSSLWRTVLGPAQPQPSLVRDVAVSAHDLHVQHPQLMSGALQSRLVAFGALKHGRASARDGSAEALGELRVALEWACPLARFSATAEPGVPGGSSSAAALVFESPCVRARLALSCALAVRAVRAGAFVQALARRGLAPQHLLDAAASVRLHC